MYVAFQPTRFIPSIYY